ncbi:conserved hypothetical protein [Bradyrhizobium sp. STM 3843]|uniref:hypothetical protein n=1 Tax=Bradyrhizobium sp. STM 3843 TaxID=551947 RepID=UPI00024053D1|nr:hypothetical protein [Bradyrhizobium sp. STM 3843]CCE11832.1 conserved hypothetical protein [Bradyrhizobium sp. STM 3843]
MSVSTLSPPASPPQQQQPSVAADANKAQTQQAQATQTTAPRAEKTGDETEAEKQASRPPLPPGQGTRVDILA